MSININLVLESNTQQTMPLLKSLKTSESVDPLTPLTLIYDSVTLPIMCKCMYRNSSRTSTH